MPRDELKPFRRILAKGLPKALEKLAQDLLAHEAAGGVDPDAKPKEHHATARILIAHLKDLDRLAEWALADEDETADDAPRPSRTLDQLRRLLDPDAEPDDHGDGGKLP